MGRLADGLERARQHAGHGTTLQAVQFDLCSAVRTGHTRRRSSAERCSTGRVTAANPLGNAIDAEEEPSCQPAAVATAGGECNRGRARTPRCRQEAGRTAGPPPPTRPAQSPHSQASQHTSHPRSSSLWTSSLQPDPPNPELPPRSNNLRWASHIMTPDLFTQFESIFFSALHSFADLIEGKVWVHRLEAVQSSEETLGQSNC